MWARLRAAAGGRTLVMGIVNVTPDSFSGDGRIDPEAAIDHGLRLVAEGADILDVGGESTRPGHRPVAAGEEIRRILPVVTALVRESGVPVSIDTWKPEVALVALEAGARIVNDIWGLRRSPQLARLAAGRQAAVILMHNSEVWLPESLTGEPLFHRVRTDLTESVAVALAAGLPAESIAIDPGIGFAKGPLQGLELMRRSAELKATGHPVVTGVSRKGWLGRLFGHPPEQRLEGTAAVAAVHAFLGVDVVRVHDVAAIRKVVEVASALGGHRPAGPTP